MKGRCTNDNGEMELINTLEGPDFDPDGVYDVYRCKVCGHIQFFQKKE